MFIHEAANIKHWLVNAKTTMTKNITKIIDDCGNIRVTLNQVHWRRMNCIQRTYSKLFGISIKAAAGLNQYFHYKDGGYPRDNSPPRYADAADKIANMFIGADYIGESDVINKHLERKFGLKLVRTKAAPPLKMRKITKDLNKNFVAAKIEHLKGITDPQEMFMALLQEMDSTQITICQLSDKIKYAGYANASQQIKSGKLKKSSFLKIIGAKAASIRSRVKGSQRKRDSIDDAELMCDTLKDCV
jgi:hypothetical protein